MELKKEDPINSLGKEAYIGKREGKKLFFSIQKRNGSSHYREGGVLQKGVRVFSPREGKRKERWFRY